LDASGVATIIDRGFRGMAKGHEHWHASVGDRRTKDRLTDQQRALNRMRAGLRAGCAGHPRERAAQTPSLS
jgi:hypothetical protein